eukprot:GHRQ01013086.1.p2 GENE.GHRQ01013086.1~~GHRQ01013086.1.p2  ORF type:complete len:146 (+),score=18.52 GHRQ01013086.1:975-1412(+)
MHLHMQLQCLLQHACTLSCASGWLCGVAVQESGGFDIQLHVHSCCVAAAARGGGADHAGKAIIAAFAYQARHCGSCILHNNHNSDLHKHLICTLCLVVSAVHRQVYIRPPATAAATPMWQLWQVLQPPNWRTLSPPCYTNQQQRS